VLHFDLLHLLQFRECVAAVPYEDGGGAWREASVEEYANSTVKGENVVLDKCWCLRVAGVVDGEEPFLGYGPGGNPFAEDVADVLQGRRERKVERGIVESVFKELGDMVDKGGECGGDAVYKLQA